MADTYKTNLNASTTGNFSEAMEKGFGIVTVMNVRVYDELDAKVYEQITPYDIASAVAGNSVSIGTGESASDLKTLLKEVCSIDTLKIANVTQEGPTKTITGGQYTNPLIKFGKTARLEMQDALGRIDAIEALGGGVAEWTGDSTKTYTGLHFGSEFSTPKLIVGESFILDKSNRQVPVNIIFYRFSPDSIFNLTQDAEGDATVFDMNGDLLTTDVLVATKSTSEGGQETYTQDKRGMFYSIVAKPAKAA